MRIAYDIIIFFAILFTPFWSVVALAVVGTLLFPRWYESIAVFAIFEFLFQGGTTQFMSAGVAVPLALYALLFVAGVEWGRTRIRQQIS